MQKYIGGIEGFLEQDAAKESAFWADYQVLGPMFAALRMFMTMDDVLTVIVGAKGCAYHLNFTIVAWGEIDFFLGKRPLPVLEYRQQQIALGDFTPPEDWLRRMKKLCGVYRARRIVLLPTDALLLCGADLAGVAGEIHRNSDRGSGNRGDVESQSVGGLRRRSGGSLSSVSRQVLPA